MTSVSRIHQRREEGDLGLKHWETRKSWGLDGPFFILPMYEYADDANELDAHARTAPLQKSRCTIRFAVQPGHAAVRRNYLFGHHRTPHRRHVSKNCETSAAVADSTAESDMLQRNFFNFFLPIARSRRIGYEYSHVTSGRPLLVVTLCEERTPLENYSPTPSASYILVQGAH